LSSTELPKNQGERDALAFAVDCFIHGRVDEGIGIAKESWPIDWPFIVAVCEVNAAVVNDASACFANAPEGGTV